MSARAAPAPEKSGLQDTGSLLSAIVVLAGVALITLALRQNPRALVLVAGLEGSVVIVLLGGVLGMLGGLRARTLLALFVPILALQLLILTARDLPFYAPLGVELTGLGTAGFLGTKLRAYWHARFGS